MVLTVHFSAKLYTGMQGLVSYQQPHPHQALVEALSRPARARRLLRLLPRQSLHPRRPIARARSRRRQLHLSTLQKLFLAGARVGDLGRRLTLNSGHKLQE